MHDHDSPGGFLSRIPEMVFRLTGVHLGTLVKVGVVLIVAIVGIGWTLLSYDPDRVGSSERPKTSYAVATLEPEKLTDEEKFRDLSMLPPDYSSKLPVERVGILNYKIEYAEELTQSESSFAELATDQLLYLYAARCNLEESEGIDSENTYRRLAQLRQQALAAGNQRRVATYDFLRALSAIKRLTQSTERADFRFASDAILNLDSKNLINASEAKTLYLDAVNLHTASSDQKSSAIFLSLVADKLIGSPERKISDLGLNLKDYPRYFRVHEAADNLAFSTRESKIEFYDELLAEIEEAPPQSPFTYRVLIELLDRMLNKTEHQLASRLSKRLGQAALTINPNVKASVNESLKNLEKRISVLGKTLDLSGATFDETPLELPNGKKTTIVFWQPTDANSLNHIVLLAESEWFDPWATNVLIACPSELKDKELKYAAKSFFEFTVLDNETAQRLALEIGIDIIPYHVSLDKENKVIRLGAAKN